MDVASGGASLTWASSFSRPDRRTPKTWRASIRGLLARDLPRPPAGRLPGAHERAGVHAKIPQGAGRSQHRRDAGSRRPPQPGGLRPGRSSRCGGAGEAEVATLYVLRQAQGHGLGAQLLVRRLRYRWRRRGPHRLMVSVLRDNIRARGFYEHLGGEAEAARQEPGPGGRPLLRGRLSVAGYPQPLPASPRNAGGR